jgi:hypothetical protein
MKYILLIAACLLVIACGNPVFSPDEVNTKEYADAAEELVDNISSVQSLMPATDNMAARETSITARDFSFYTKLPQMLPKCSKLFSEGKAVRFTYYADECVWIILQTQEHIFNTHLQCLKVGTKVDCDPFETSTLVQQKKLGTGLLYEEVKNYQHQKVN